MFTIFIEKIIKKLLEIHQEKVSKDLAEHKSNHSKELEQFKETLTIQLTNIVDRKLIDFHKEITDKCFSSMENIMRYSKEISLIDSLATKIKDDDLINLERTLLKPIMEKKWEEEKQTQINVINDNAEKILKRYNELKEKFLVMQREKKETKEIEIELKTLEFAMGKQ